MINKYKNKKDLYEYIEKKLSKNSALILIRGSTAKKKIKRFSDFDIEVYGKKIKKPYYEIALIKGKPILISAYFYRYKRGKKIKGPSNTKIIYGEYNDKINSTFSKDNYNQKEKIKRECQLITDFLFKYLRNKDVNNLNIVQSKIK